MKGISITDDNDVTRYSDASYIVHKTRKMNCPHDSEQGSLVGTDGTGIRYELTIFENNTDILIAF
jgi:hypothetical protein